MQDESDKDKAIQDDLSLKGDNEVDPVALDHAQEPSSSPDSSGLDSLSREEVEAEAEKSMFKKLWGGEYQGSVTKLWGVKQQWSFEGIKKFMLQLSKIEFAIVCFPLLTYLVLISVVWAYPEIMKVLGLEPWVKYMMYEVQPEGYRNLMRIAGYPFANYFFQIHTASLLIFILSCAMPFVMFLCFLVFNIPLANVQILKKNMEAIEKPNFQAEKFGKKWQIFFKWKEAFVKKHLNVKVENFNVFMFVIFFTVMFMVIFFVTFDRPSWMKPSGESSRGGFDADYRGISWTVIFWALCISLFNLIIWPIFYVISCRLWPRLKKWMIKDR